MPIAVTRRSYQHFFEQHFWVTPPSGSTVFEQPWFHMIHILDPGHLYYAYSAAGDYWWTPNYGILPGDVGMNPDYFADYVVNWYDYLGDTLERNPEGAHGFHIKLGEDSGNLDGTTGGATLFNDPAWTGGTISGGTASGYSASLFQNNYDKLDNTSVWPDSPVGSPNSGVSAVNRFHAVYNNTGKSFCRGWMTRFANALRDRLSSRGLSFPANYINDSEANLNNIMPMVQRANNGNGQFIQTGTLYAHLHDARYASEVLARGMTLSQLVGGPFSYLGTQSGLSYSPQPDPAGEAHVATLVLESSEDQFNYAYYQPWLAAFPKSRTAGWKSCAVPAGQTLNQSPEVSGGSFRVISQQSYCNLSHPTLPFYNPKATELDAEFAGNPDQLRLTWFKRRKAWALLMAQGNPGKPLAAWMNFSGWGAGIGLVPMSDDDVITLLDYMWEVGFRKIMWWADPLSEAVNWSAHAALAARVDARYRDASGVSAPVGRLSISRNNRGPNMTSRESGVPKSVFDQQSGQSSPIAE